MPLKHENLWRQMDTVKKQVLEDLFEHVVAARCCASPVEIGGLLCQQSGELKMLACCTFASRGSRRPLSRARFTSLIPPGEP